MLEIKNSNERFKLNTAHIEDVRDYWEDQITRAKNDLVDFENTINKETKDYEIIKLLSLKRSYVELMDLAVSLEQYKRCSATYEPVTRVLRIRIDLARPLIEKYFDLKTVSLYGIGLYAPIEGLMLSESFRVSSKYDESLSPLKGSPAFDISTLPEDIRKEYDFRLAIPAIQGLFVPKKSRLITEWVGTTKQLEYFDLTLVE